MKPIYRFGLIFAAVLSARAVCQAQSMAELAQLAPGWEGVIAAKVDQSYVGWDVEIGDADNDDRNDILTTSCPGSRLYLFKSKAEGWQTHLLAENLAQHKPGMGLSVRVVDLNRDEFNEVVLGTGQEADETAFFYVLQTDGHTLTKKLVSRPEENKSAYTHSFGIADLDRDGVLEVLSAYCGHGEIMRYDVDSGLTQIHARKIHQLSGSGEESILADVDNDGKVEFVTANCFRKEQAKLEIFEFDDKGELMLPARVVIEGMPDRPCFYVSCIVGDLDNDGKNELVAGWKQEQAVNKSSLLAYRVAEKAELAYTLDSDTEDLDMGYFEKMMAIADADNDGKNELVVSTRGDNASENITSQHLGNVFLYRISDKGETNRTKLADFNEAYAESSWLAVGDADSDGQDEVVLATGKGDRTKPGTSYVVVLKHANP